MEYNCKVIIIHASDWHGQWHKLPHADLYIFSGDMYPNDPIVIGYERHIIVEREKAFQKRWVDRHKEGFREKILENPGAPVVTCGGNHDFIEFGELFKGGPHYEIGFGDRTFDVNGLRIGGSRGINYIAGEWNDEMRDPDLDECFERLPGNLDIVVTHSPPLGILDEFYGERFGVRALSSYINRCQYEDGWKLPSLFCFGHIHNQHSTITKAYGDVEITFSNAATTYNKLAIEL